MSKPITKLRHYREKKFWNQEELSAESGVSRPTISAAENGSRISLGNIKKLANALGVEPGKLL